MMNDLESSFHLCSLKEECSYVFDNVRNGEFNERQIEASFAVDERYPGTWEKIAPGVDNFVLCLRYFITYFHGITL